MDITITLSAEEAAALAADTATGRTVAEALDELVHAQLRPIVTRQREYQRAALAEAAASLALPDLADVIALAQTKLVEK